MLGGIVNVFRVPEIRSKLLITVGFLLLYRVGWNIPLPGIDLQEDNSHGVAPPPERVSVGRTNGA